jgi:hypothetical protein
MQYSLPLRTYVRSRDTGEMPLSLEQIESLRRSNAMGSLPQSQIDELLETAAELARRQREISKALHSLGSRWPGVRAALNELNKLTR